MKIKSLFIIFILFLGLYSRSIYAIANTADTYTSTGTITTQVDSAYSSSAAPLIKLHTHRSPVQWLVRQFRQDITPTISVSGPAGKIILEKKIITDDSSLTLDTRSLIPGSYSVAINDRTVTNFSWGVLAINTNKSTYTTGETATLSLAVLDETGNMVCDADVVLTITAPDGIQTVLRTADRSITVSDTCHQRVLTLTPDFAAAYHIPIPGTYIMDLSATTKNGNFRIRDLFTAENHSPFSVERITVTRVYPPKTYPMTFHLDFNRPFSGEITEQIPSGFQISDIGQNGQLTTGSDGTKKILWSVSAVTGDRIELSYEFKTPDKSPNWFTLGPLSITENSSVIFKESRPWQLAIDANVRVQYFRQYNPCNSGIGYTFSSPNTLHNFIVVFVSGGGTTDSMGFTDTQGNTYTALAINRVGPNAQIFYAKDIKGGANSITATYSGWTDVGFTAAEYSGVDTSSPFDTEAPPANINGGSSFASGSFTPTVSGDLIFAGWANENNDSSGLTCTGGDMVVHGTNHYDGTCQILSGTTGAQTLTFSGGAAAGTNLVNVAAFKMASGGGVGSTGDFYMQGVQLNGIKIN